MAGRRALITGITGFVGSHLAEHLSESGWEVGGFDLRPHWPPDTPPVAARIWTGDLHRPADISAVLSDFAPDIVFHLAAVAAATVSAADPLGSIGRTVETTLILCEAMKAMSPRPALFITGSATVYGRVKHEDLPIREEHPIRPISAYGVAKAAQELCGWKYRDSDGFRVFVTRSFNAAGPRQSPDFFLPRLCREVARREAGLEPNTPVPMGTLDVGRDYLDVRDMVRACADLADTPEAEGRAINVCTGRPIVLREMADLVRNLARVPVTIQTDESRIPVSQDTVAYGDPRLLAELTGFAPRHRIEDTVEAVLEYARRRAQVELAG